MWGEKMAASVRASRLPKEVFNIIIVNKNSGIYDILSVLAVVGEISPRSLHLLGEDNTMKRIVKKCTTPQEFRNSEDGNRVNATLFLISGRGIEKTIRLKKDGNAVLRWCGDSEYYKSAYCNNFGSGKKVIRHHRLAEAAMIFQRAGIEIQPRNLPVLSDSLAGCRQFDKPYFYLSTVLKNAIKNDLDDEDRVTRLSTSRFVGMFTTPENDTYAVYNTGNEPLKLNINSEYNVKHEIISLKRTTFFSPEDQRMKTEIYKTILLCNDFEIGNKAAFSELYKNDADNKNRWQKPIKREMLSDVCNYCFAVPLTDFGAKLLMLYSVPNYKAKIRRLFFDESVLLPFEQSNFDAKFETEDDNTRFEALLFDSELKRLNRIKGTIEDAINPKIKYKIHCFAEQYVFYRNLFADSVEIVTYSIDDILERL